MQKNILITGAGGFIARNLIAMLNTNKEYSLSFTYRHDDVHLLRQQVKNCDFIFHLAGENRPLDETLYETNNFQYTDHICSALIEAGRPYQYFSSSVQANSGTAYGLSKLKAEKRLQIVNSLEIASLLLDCRVFLGSGVGPTTIVL